MSASTLSPDTNSLTERNRTIVERFVDLFYRQRKVRLAFETYGSDHYVQHNPNIADGREAPIPAQSANSHPRF